MRRQSFCPRRYSERRGHKRKIRKKKNSRIKGERREVSILIPTDEDKDLLEEVEEELSPSEISIGFALQWMVDNEILVGWQQSEKSDNWDRAGVDFVAWLPSGFAIPLQLKFRSGDRLRMRVRKKHETKHPLVRIFIDIGHEDLIFSEAEIEKIKALAKKLFNVFWPSADFENFVNPSTS